MKLPHQALPAATSMTPTSRSLRALFTWRSLLIFAALLATSWTGLLALVPNEPVERRVLVTPVGHFTCTSRKAIKKADIQPQLTRHTTFLRTVHSPEYELLRHTADYGPDRETAIA